MCGRYTLQHNTGQMVARFEIDQVVAESMARYNIAPTEQIAVVREDGRGRLLEPMQWGLIPSWAQDRKIANKMFNARSETALEKPSFRGAVARRRCIVPADGFYEWKREGDRKQPMHIRRRDGELFGFAGLWEEWRAPEGELIHSCTILTGEPNELMAQIHNRMPMILRAEDEPVWLDSSVRGAEAVSMLKPYESGLLEAFPVSAMVNRAGNDSASCIEPFGD